MSRGMKKKGIAISLCFILVICFFQEIPGTQNIKRAKASNYDTLVSAFINDSRFANGVSWGGSQTPKISSWSSEGCCAYVNDFAKYVHGLDSCRDGIEFTDLSQVQAGDVLHGNSGSAGQHWIAVLYRNGNTLYTAEGNFGSQVRISSTGYTISGNQFCGPKEVFTFDYGFHYSIDTSSTEPKLLDCYLENQDATGYIIACEIENPSSVTAVQCATWEMTNEQDDLIWRDMAYWYDGNIAKLYVPYAEHNNKTGRYQNHIYINGSLVGEVKHFRGTKTLEDGKYRIILSEYPEFGMDVANVNYTDGTNIQIYQNTTEDNQIYEITYLGDGFYKIIHCDSGKSIDVAGGLKSDSTNLQLYTWNDTDSQKWVIYEISDGVYGIISKCSDKVINVSGGVFENERNVNLYFWNNTISQYWMFLPENNVSENEPEVTPNPTPIVTSTPEATISPIPDGISTATPEVTISPISDAISTVAPEVTGSPVPDAESTPEVPNSPAKNEMSSSILDESVNPTPYTATKENPVTTSDEISNEISGETEILADNEESKKIPKFSKKTVTIKKGKKVKLKVLYASGYKIKWKSANKKVAAVSKNGVVKGKKKGKTVITAIVKGKKIICRVKIK